VVVLGIAAVAAAFSGYVILKRYIHKEPPEPRCVWIPEVIPPWLFILK